MFSPAKSITAGVLVFALGGVLLIAQPFDQRGVVAPGAETDAEPAAPVEVSGQHIGYDPNDDQDYAIQMWSMSDPRLDGTFKWFAHGGMDPDIGPIGFEVWAYVIENDEGTWRGIPDAWAALPDADGPPPADMIFEGEGAYEGLTLVARFVDDPDDGYAMRGYIIDGDFALPSDLTADE